MLIQCLKMAASWCAQLELQVSRDLYLYRRTSCVRLILHSFLHLLRFQHFHRPAPYGGGRPRRKCLRPPFGGEGSSRGCHNPSIKVSLLTWTQNPRTPGLGADSGLCEEICALKRVPIWLGSPVFGLLLTRRLSLICIFLF